MNKNITVLKGDSTTKSVFYMPKNGKIVNLKNANSEVAEVSVENKEYIKIVGKNAGKTKISFTVKYGKKKKKY